MKHITKLLALMLALACLFSMAACTTAGNDGEDTTNPDAEQKMPETVRVATLKGPTGMGMAQLMDASAKGSTALNYNFTVEAAPDTVRTLAINGDIDIAALPVNVASVLYAKTEGKFQVAGINTRGVLYLVEAGNTIQSVADLRGKTICAAGQGSTPEYILNYVLTQNGLTPGTDVTVEYLTEHAEVITALASGKATIGLLPEPNVTSALSSNQNLRIAVDMTEAWDAVSEQTLVQGCVVVSRAFAETYPAAVKTFLEEYAASVDFVNGNPEEASAMIEAQGIVPKAALAKKAIPTCNICLIVGDEMKATLSALYEVLHAANPASIGGKIPADDFYYTAK